MNNNKCSSRLKTATTDKIIEKIHNKVIDWRIKVCELTLQIPQMIVFTTSYEHLHMKKLSARLPRLLTVYQKCIRMNVSKECLNMFKRNSIDFLRRFIKHGLHHYTPRHKDETTVETWVEWNPQWMENVASKKAKTVSIGKVMVTVLGFFCFWDFYDIVLIDYLKN